MVFYDMQEIGGLEEYAVTLASSLQQKGNPVSALVAMWAPPDNQYVRRLRDAGVRVVQWPKWVSYPASHWPTKVRFATSLTWVCGPLVFALAVADVLVRRKAWSQSRDSARNWLRGQLLNRVVGPDRRQTLARGLLRWWRVRWHPDVLHVQGYTSNLLFVLDWADTVGLPVVYEEHQTPDPQFNWWQDFPRSINKASLVVAVSKKSADALREVCKVQRPIVVRHPLLADPLRTGWRRDPRATDADGLDVTTVARLGVTKGLTYLLDAIVHVKATHPSTRFRVYGDGESRQELLDHADRLGLDGAAIFVGPFTTRDELARIMATTDIFVMSSVLEGQPLGLVEAMAYGCPIVATAVGGIPELIQERVNGMLCAPRDPECLARGISALLDDAELRERLGRAARRTYEGGPYQPEALSEHFISLYGRVLNSSR
jgi:glycosyltransferase involved in cell wall biosynthesis